ncbi:GNAT superfamily N-acetyltransferase [Arthrobacter stackebrandtii]|uniref:GNAT superfamily N-acetyltransferase n=1 Tax=Arthrobacter stackebrandtii TaxID=272161 RepID=A0ABS4YZ97_9MICC|nr:GNAT family N-acetyltransferase [Arthrobacter stackebrandtii]MBP2414116.1 GNAT superfamily N-acetyltransferase [Arthrobacter stackebrandtii]PYG99343.1 GNAT family N-acetyltransferase [Arthrobacter stackebrandtii]
MWEIRPAALSEFALLPAIEAEADEAFEALTPAISTARFPPPGDAAEYAAAFHIMVAGRPPVGFVRLEIVDGGAHLEQLAVSPDYAGQGIGRALVTAAKAWAREAGFRHMTLCTFRDVPFNAPFYASCGFVEMRAQDLGEELRQLRQHEAGLGMDALGVRVAMEAVLTQGRDWQDPAEQRLRPRGMG